MSNGSSTTTTSPKIPFLDLATPHADLHDEILAEWSQILKSAAFIGGPALDQFEAAFAKFAGSRLAVGVSNGTDALRLALLAMGISPGDEVITSPHTFIATTEAISQAGGRPVFVDVQEATGNIDPELIEQALTPRTRFLLPVHLYGQTADMDPILELARRHGLRVLEDASQAHGAEYRGRRAGSLAEAAAFSFYPGKNLGACGEAGAITTDDDDLAARLRQLRDHGQRMKYHHDIEGYNARLDALQAAALTIKLRHIDDWTERRRDRARRYSAGLEGSGVELPLETPGNKHVYHLYVIRHRWRDALKSALEEAGIGTGLHYPVPLHLQTAYNSMGLGPGTFPVAERWASWGLSLPMFPTLSDEQVDRVVDAVRAAAR